MNRSIWTVLALTFDNVKSDLVTHTPIKVYITTVKMWCFLSYKTTSITVIGGLYLLCSTFPTNILVCSKSVDYLSTVYLLVECILVLFDLAPTELMELGVDASYVRTVLGWNVLALAKRCTDLLSPGELRAELRVDRHVLLIVSLEARGTDWRAAEQQGEYSACVT